MTRCQTTSFFSFKYANLAASGAAVECDKDNNNIRVYADT